MNVDFQDNFEMHIIPSNFLWQEWNPRNNLLGPTHKMNSIHFFKNDKIQFFPLIIQEAGLLFLMISSSLKKSSVEKTWTGWYSDSVGIVPSTTIPLGFCKDNSD